MYSTCVHGAFTVVEACVDMTSRNFSGNGQGRVHPWKSSKLMQGPI